jgi:hypothetical protein
MAFGEPMPLRGLRGVIQWYYMTAAEVRDYTVTYSQERRAWMVRGGVVAPDAFKLQQRPLMFTVPVKGGGALRWPVLDVTIQAGRLMANLGPPGKDT